MHCGLSKEEKWERVEEVLDEVRNYECYLWNLRRELRQSSFVMLAASNGSEGGLFQDQR